MIRGLIMNALKRALRLQTKPAEYEREADVLRKTPRPPVASPPKAEVKPPEFRDGTNAAKLDRAEEPAAPPEAVSAADAAAEGPAKKASKRAPAKTAKAPAKAAGKATGPAKRPARPRKAAAKDAAPKQTAKEPKAKKAASTKRAAAKPRASKKAEPKEPEPAAPRTGKGAPMGAGVAAASDTAGAPLSHDAVQQVLDDMVRPALQGDGGDITLLRIEGTDIFVRLVGACSTCSSSIVTMKMGVEALLREEFPSMTNLVQVD